MRSEYSVLHLTKQLLEANTTDWGEAAIKALGAAACKPGDQDLATPQRRMIPEPAQSAQAPQVVQV